MEPKITIELSSYNIELASVKLILELIKDKPGLTTKKYSEILGISERTIYRWIDKYNIPLKKKVTTIGRAMEILEAAGYEISKKQ